MSLDYNFIVKTTTSCPGKCACCVNRRKLFENERENFDVEVFRKICERIKALGGEYICLSGGEPTVFKLIDNFVKIAHEYGLAIRMNTNGWGLTEEKLERWVSLGLDQIVLSVYGIDKETVKRTRGNTALFKKSLDAINAIKQIKKKQKFIFILQSTIMKYNYKEFPKILELAITSGADIFWPSYLEDAFNLPDVRLNKMDIEKFRNDIKPEMKRVVDKFIKDEMLAKRMKVEIDGIYINEYEGYIYHDGKTNCQWPGKHFTFYPSGRVDPCPGHEYFQSNQQINVNYVEIEKFLTEENLKKGGENEYEYCKYCPQGEHQEIRLTNLQFHEHSKKTVL